MFPTPLAALFRCFLAGDSALGIRMPGDLTEISTRRNLPHRAAQHARQSHATQPFLAGGMWAAGRCPPPVLGAAPLQRGHLCPMAPVAGPRERQWPQSVVPAPQKCPHGAAAGQARAAERHCGAQLAAGAHAEPSAPPHVKHLPPAPPGYVSALFGAISRFC